MDYVKYFKKGGWIALGRYYVLHPKKLMRLLRNAKKFASKEGLAKVKEDLFLICQYIRDIFTGQYKDYKWMNLVIMVAAIVYVVAPIDILPDFIPFTGLIDDSAILLWAASEFSEELEKYKNFLTSKAKDENRAAQESDIEDIEFEEIPPYQITQK